MQLDTQAQMRRIQRKTALRDDLLMVRVETDGGPQTMAALALHGLPGWLYTIDESRVASETAREAVILFQREATDILFRYFGERPAQISQPATLVPSEPITHPAQPSPDAPPVVWAEYYEQMAKWVRWQADIVAWQQGVERWRGAVESHLESVEEVTRLVPEILQRLGPQTLTPEHQATIQHLARRLHELSGFAYATIYGELNAAFHVGRYSDIADARWPEIAAWFKVRIAAAERRGAR